MTNKSLKRIVTFAALKGGIGKTTISTNVAVQAAKLGNQVLLIDLDPEACATNALAHADVDLEQAAVFYDILDHRCPDLESAIIPGMEKNLFLIPSALRNHHCEKKLSNQNPKKIIRSKIESLNFDLIILELPPSFTTLTGSAYLAADLIVLPCTPSIFSLESVSLTIEAVSALAREFEVPEKKFKVLMNQFNSKRIASQEVLSALKEDYSELLLDITIGDSADISNAINAGKSVFDSKCAPKIRNSFERLTDLVIQ